MVRYLIQLSMKNFILPEYISDFENFKEKLQARFCSSLKGNKISDIN